MIQANNPVALVTALGLFERAKQDKDTKGALTVPCPYPTHKVHDCVVEVGEKQVRHFTPFNRQPWQKEPFNDFRDHALALKRPAKSIPILRELVEADERAPWLWQGYIRAGELTLLSALMKAGKTTITYHLLSMMELGLPFLNQPTQTAQVIYATEEPAGIIIDRIDEDHPALRRDPQMAVITLEPGLRGAGVIQAIKDSIAHYKPGGYPLLVVVDTISFLLDIQDENDSAEINTRMAPLVEMARSEGAAFLLLHHTAKNLKGSNQIGTGGRGSGALSANVDHVIEFFRAGDLDDPGETRRILKGAGRSKATPPELLLNFDPATKQYAVLGTFADFVSRRDKEIMSYKLAHPDATQIEVGQALGLSQSTVSRSAGWREAVSCIKDQE